MDPLKATKPDAEAKGLQCRTTFKNGIFDGRIKKTVSSARLGDDQTWARLALQQEKGGCVTLLANIDPELRRVCRRSARTRSMEK